MHDFTLTPRQARGGIFSVALSVPRKFLSQGVAVSHCLYLATRRMVFGLSSPRLRSGQAPSFIEERPLNVKLIVL